MGTHHVATRALFILALAAPAVLSIGCSQSVVVHTATNPTAPFGKYATFSFGPEEGAPRGYRMASRSPELQQRLETLIGAALTQRGYQRATGNADLVVMFGAGRREVVEKGASDDVAGEWQPDDETADFVEGSLVVDAFDGSTNARVWHGAGHSQVDPKRIDDAELQRMVTSIVEKFPARGGA